MTWESRKRRAQRRRRQSLRGQGHQVQDPGTLGTCRARQRWWQSQEDRKEEALRAEARARRHYRQ
jgi:hypothetical protein